MMGNGSRISTQRNRKVTLPPGYSQLHWMKMTQSGQDLSGLQHGPKRRLISMTEVAKHCTEDDLWTVLDGKVYNLTFYLPFHPGGISTLMMSAGSDCTALFNENHAWVNGHSMLEKCLIGTLDPDSISPDEIATTDYALDPIQWRLFKLISKQIVCTDTVKFSFELPPGKKLGLTIPGQHLKIRARLNGQVIERAYTPSSKLTQLGSFDLLIKIYSNGLMTSYLETIEPGASLEMLGPHGVIGYPSPQIITHGTRVVQDQANHLLLLAAGSGITPMLQLVRAVFERSEDTTTTISLLYCNHSLAHIIALDQLEPMGQLFPQRISIHHFLSQCTPDDTKSLENVVIGRLTASRLSEEIEPWLVEGRVTSLAVFCCGPPTFEELIHATLSQYKMIPSTQIHTF